MSIAYIDGDTQYETKVLFVIGGNREEQLRIIARKMVEDQFLESWGDDEFYQKYDPNNEVNWEDTNEEEKFLIKVLSQDLTIFNSDLTKAYEIYTYISEQDENHWYLHFKYITGGQEGIKISYNNLETGEIKLCD